MHTVSRTIGKNTITIETGRMAKQADGSVLVKYGGTAVLAAAVRSKPRQDIDYFPLFMDYRENTYAAGKFPGGFFKREGRPSAKEILTCRLMDRPIRPLFAEGYRDETMVMAAVLSADKENDPDVLAVVGASAALSISPVPFLGPIGTVRVGLVDGEYIVNPTTTELEESRLNLIVTASKEGVVMMEGGAQEIEEDVMLKAIEFGFEQAQELIALQEELIAAVSPVKREVGAPDDGGLAKQITDKYGVELEQTSFTAKKKERADAMRDLLDKIVEDLGSEDGPTPSDIKNAFDVAEEEVVRKNILEGKRYDGRGPKDIREITCEVGLLDKTHGSALFTRGETQALAVTTLGTKEDEQKIDGLNEAYYKSFLLHYNFPPYSVGEIKPVRGPSRRDIGHGMLAEKSLAVMLPDKETFGYTIRIVSDTLESNGSSSMAAVCGGTLSLMDAGVPIKRPVAGIAMGLVTEGDKAVVLTDIAGAEDHMGDMDLKVAGTQKGITGFQMDIKIDSIKVELFGMILEQAKEARLDILRSMLAVLSEPRKEVSEHAPKLVAIKINPDTIGTLIGPRGKNIKALQEETETKVEVDDDGTVSISGDDMDKVKEAVARVKALTMEIKVGEIFEQAKVLNVRDDFGAFVELAPGRDALLHISELANEFVKSVTDHVKEGDIVRVKVTKVDDQGKVRVSKKVLE